MTTELARRLHDIAERYRAILGADASTLVEAAGQIETLTAIADAYKTATAAISADIERLIDRDLELKRRSSKHAEAIAVHRSQIGQHKQAIRADRFERRRILMQVHGLRQALREIGSKLPLSVKEDPAIVHPINVNLTLDYAADLAVLSEIVAAEPELPLQPPAPGAEEPEFLEQQDEWHHEPPPPRAESEAPSQPDRGGIAADQTENGAKGEHLSETAETFAAETGG